MPIPLGRTFVTDPTFMLWQIVATVTLFLLVLGATDYFLAVVAFFSFHAFSSDSHLASTSLSQRLMVHLQQVPLRTIFTYTTTSLPAALTSTTNSDVTTSSLAPSSSMSGTPPVPSSAEVVHTVGGDFHFLFLHLMSAFVAAIFISRMIQRRKFVTDFTLTIYAVYTLIAWFALGSLPLWTGVWWCVCVVAGACVMWIVMQWYCQRLELQDITLVPLAASSSATTSASAPIQITSSSTGSSIVMVAGSNGEHHVRSPPSIFSGGHHHHRTASGVGLLASTATTTTSPQGVCGLNASGVQREPSPTPMVVEMTPNSIKRR